MVMEQKIDKTKVARAVVAKIEEDWDTSTIKSKHIVGFEHPNPLSIKGKDEKYTPDIIASHKHGTSVYEIELDDTYTVDKWKIFSLYARKNNGNLFLVIPDYLRKSVKETITENKINAGIIYFNTDLAG